MPNFLEDYEPVEDRLRAFWQDNPSGRVVTVLIEHADGHYIVRAEVFRTAGDLPVASGLAEESKSDRGVNATSALENCETSAIGRALANLGYAAKGKRPSREEMSKASGEGHGVRGEPGTTIESSRSMKHPSPGLSSGAVAAGDPLSVSPSQEPAPGTTSVVVGEDAADTGPGGTPRVTSPPPASTPLGPDQPGPPHYPLRPDECSHKSDRTGHLLRPRKSPRGPVCPRCGLSYIAITEGTTADLEPQGYGG